MERGDRPADGRAKAKEQPPSPEMERGGRPAGGRAKAKEQPPSRKKQPPTGICLVATDPSSVALTVSQPKLGDHRRGRTTTVPGAARFLSDP
ncbi:hypothetical protein D1007_57114 [Hordeum vulgare]|nr:hypothetical protein D1007_57114 [Hordeum vulgare]KAI5016574.1 hypothetical protein ZWY2020_006425 [Hordeum vulgare]